MEEGLHFYRTTLERFTNFFLDNIPIDGAASDDSAESDPPSEHLLHLFNKQEYYRQAYNETISRMKVLEKEIPEFAQPYLHHNYHQTSVEREQDPDIIDEESSDIELEPEMVEFMLQTMKHREERDRNMAEQIKSRERPPPLNKPVIPSYSPTTKLESDLIHYYTQLSHCSDAPLWPFIPLRTE